MLDRLRGAWGWFADGLVEALLWVADHAHPAKQIRLDLGADDLPVSDGGGRRLGRLVVDGDVAVFEPAELARRVTGSSVELVVPPGWLARRQLDPVAAASRPFLDAFVRHQIERVTPWRVGDTHYRILERVLPEDPTRIAVGVAVVPRRLVARPVEALSALHPRALLLRGSDDPSAEAVIALAAGRPALAGRLRRAVAWGIGMASLAAVASTATLQWQAAAVGDDIAEQDRVLDERKAVSARERRGADPNGAAATELRALRERRAPALAVIDALSAALPDSAHLTALSIDGDRVTVAGVSSDPSALVPALETSGAFAEVAFGAATAKAQAGAGDTFTLEMRALPPRSDHAAAPPGAAVARSTP